MAEPTHIKPYLRLSGLEHLIVRPEMNFVNIGERTNVTGSKKFARLVRDGKYEEALSVARQQVDRAVQRPQAFGDQAIALPPSVVHQISGDNKRIRAERPQPADRLLQRLER